LYRIYLIYHATTSIKIIVDVALYGELAWLNVTAPLLAVVYGLPCVL